MQFKKSLFLCLALWSTAATAASALVTPVQRAATTHHLQPQQQTLRGGAAAIPKAPLTKLKSDAAAAAASGASQEGDGGEATIPNEVFNLVKGIVGSGVLSLPYGIAVYGNAPSAVLPATILITLMGLISAYTFGLIGRVCQATNTQSYSDAWDATVGTSSAWLVAFSCVFDCFAGCLRYVRAYVSIY